MAWQVSGAFAADAVVAVEFGSGAGAGLRVGGPGRGGEHERQVGVGAAGHRRVQPLPVLAAGDQRDPGVHGGALGGVPGDRVGQVSRLVAGVAEGPAGEPPLPGGPVRVEEAADHDAAAVMASIRRMSPLARARPGSPASMAWSLRRQMIRSPAEASAPSAIRMVRRLSTRPRWIRSSRIRADSSRQRAQSAAISRTSRPAR